MLLIRNTWENKSKWNKTLIKCSKVINQFIISQWTKIYSMILKLISIQSKIGICTHGKSIPIVKYMNLYFLLKFQSILHLWIVMLDLETYSSILKVDKLVVYIRPIGNIDLIIHWFYVIQLSNLLKHILVSSLTEMY